MPEQPRAYRRLPGTGWRPFRTVRLWLGTDHLLLATLQGFVEEYQRFYLRDVQAIVVRRTNRRAHLGTLFSLLTLLTLLFAAGSRGGFGRGFWGAVAALFAAALAINLSRGPTCACHLRTPLQTRALPSLHRIRLARRALAIVRPRIEEAQGTIGSEEVLARAAEPVATIAPAADPSPVAAAPAAASRHENGQAHLILALLLLADAAVTPLQIRYQASVGLTLVGLLTYMAQLGFVIAALIRQRGSDAVPTLVRFAWTSLAALILFYMLAAGQTFVRAFGAALSGTPAPAIPEFSIHLAGVQVFAMIVQTLLGVWGLLAVRIHRRITGPGR